MSGLGCLKFLGLKGTGLGMECFKKIESMLIDLVEKGCIVHKNKKIRVLELQVLNFN